MIEYRDVHKAFDAPVLSGIDLTVHRGERLALVGPSGTGKSVLLKTTIGLLIPDRGDVLVEGESVIRADRRTLERVRRKVGYVFQNAALFDSLNVWENMLMGLPEGADRALGVREVRRRIEESLEDVHLEPARVLAKMPSELSGGMRKRVGLARSMVGRPEVLLYDEPVTGLDPVSSAAVARLIVDIAERYGVTSVLVTHDVEGALAISDRIALLDRGLLRFVGTPSEFVQSADPLVRAFARRADADALVAGSEVS